MSRVNKFIININIDMLTYLQMHRFVIHGKHVERNAELGEDFNYNTSIVYILRSIHVNML